MIDAANLPKKTTLECNLSDLPSTVLERISFHLLDDEKICLCVLSSGYNEFEVAIVTTVRVVQTVVQVGKGIPKFGTMGYQNNSLMLSELAGLEQNEGESPDRSGCYLTVLCGSRDLRFYFWNREICLKFAGAILSSADQLTKRFLRE